MPEFRFLITRTQTIKISIPEAKDLNDAKRIARNCAETFLNIEEDDIEERQEDIESQGSYGVHSGGEGNITQYQDHLTVARSKA